MSSRRGVLLVLLLILFAVAISVGSLIFLGMATGAPAPVPANATLYLKLEAPFSEVDSLDVFSSFVERSPTLREVLENIRKAKRDSRIKTLVIMPNADGALWAQLQEVRDALIDFKKSGKPITAFLEYGGAQDYFVATAADRIVLMPAGQLDLSGLATYEIFFRGALDKLGVYPDLLHIGDYKTASNTFTEKGFTPAHREMTRSLNRDWYNQLVHAIAESRKRSDEDVRGTLDNGPFLAEGAKRFGLVDELAYEDQIDDAPPVQGTRKIDGQAYARASLLTAPSTGSRIALLYAVGTIASGKSSFDGAGGGVVGSETFNEWLRKVRADSSVRAVVVRIDSPGGSAVASEVMWREVMLTRDVKPVIVSMGNVAASGGYYIAAPAHVIVAEPGTITGSIGVVTGKFAVQTGLEKLGIATDVVSDGKMAEIYSPFKPFSKEERARLAEQMQATYDLFLARVADGRHSTPAKIDTIARGRVWTGRQARDLGLVDTLGGLETALQVARERAKIDPAKELDVIVYPPKRSLYEVLANPFGSSVEAGLSLFVRRPDARVMDSTLSLLRLFRRGEPLTVMPNVFWN